MSDDHQLSLSGKEVRSIQLNSWISSTLIFCGSALVASRIFPQMYAYLPVGFVLMMIPMHTYFQLERRKRDLPRLSTPRFFAGLAVATAVFAGVSYGLQRLLSL